MEEAPSHMSMRSLSHLSLTCELPPSLSSPFSSCFPVQEMDELIADSKRDGRRLLVFAALTW